jgi:hypothetical protein
MFASINGLRCHELTITIPARGIWIADAQSPEDLPSTTGAATIALAGLTLTGFIVRAGNFLDDSSARVVGGHGGWDTEIGERYYQNPFGVKLRQVLTDAATAAGERITFTVADQSIGAFYARKRAPAKRALNQLASQWWVGADGATTVGPRPNTPIVSRFDVIADGTDLGIGRVQIATDKPEDWLPGVLFAAPTITEQRQASTIVHRLTSDTLRTTIWTSP